MEIYRRANSPYWYVDLVDETTKRRIRKSTGEKDKRLAQRAAAKLLEEVEAEANLVRDGKRPVRLREALEDYIAHLKQSGKVSHGRVQQDADKVMGTLRSSEGKSRWHLDGSMWLHDLEPVTLKDLVKHRFAEGNAAQTIAHELRTLRAATNYAKGLKYRVPDIEDWRLPKITRKTRYLSWDEFERLLAELSPDRVFSQVGRGGREIEYRVKSDYRRQMMQDAQDLAVALALCGGRWAEVSGLRWPRIDFERGMIRLYGSKTEKERLAPLPATLRAILERRYEAATDKAGLIFPGRFGAQRKGSCRAILRAMDRAGLNTPDLVAQDGRATVHSLRHTFASWLAQGGADLARLQMALGHASLDMTRRYSHLVKSEEVGKLSEILDKVGA